MTTIAVFLDDPRAAAPCYRAVAGEDQSVGASIGSAVDALTDRLGPPTGTTLIVVQPQQADPWFPAAERDRLAHLMDRWRAARDAGAALTPAEQRELDALAAAELAAAARRAAALLPPAAP